jgi:hypothetical protein
VHINKVIGGRLADLVSPAQRDDFLEAMGWKEQTYYEARTGRREFRVAELIAMAIATKQPAWTFLDATATEEAVTFSVGAATRSRRKGRRKPHNPIQRELASDEVLDLFGTPREQKGRAWRALVALNEVVGDLVAINEYIDTAYRELRPLFPDYKQWEGENK